MEITSLQNPRIKHIVKLRDDKKTRKQDGLMLVEGYDEIQLALAAGHLPQTLLSAPELVSRHISGSFPETITVNRAVFEKVSYRDNPDGWMGIFPTPHISLDELRISRSPLVIVAESIEKPGNLGAMLRTADAADWMPYYSVTRAWTYGIQMLAEPAVGRSLASQWSNVTTTLPWNG